MSQVLDRRPQPVRVPLVLIFPALFLCGAYSLLALTFLQHPSGLMDRCVLMNINLARIWSVAHVEIGMSYMGVFIGMTYYLLKAGRLEKTHLHDLAIATAYLVLSFILDYECVKYFTPFRALLVGDAIVMTFTLLVSKQLWFQRLLGIFVPLVFLTCSFGHLMEGLSFWKLTYPINVPWTMVTADIGFAILVNATRFPAFIRGHDVESEMAALKEAARVRQLFLQDVLASVTEGKLHLVAEPSELPALLDLFGSPIALQPESLSHFRRAASEAWRDLDFPQERESDMIIAIGEATMNAVVHGNGGTAEIRADKERFQIWIIDRGPGITIDILPKATLEKGYSTSGSLGHGFYMILQTVDHVDFSTGAAGTTMALTFDRSPRQHEFASFLQA